MDKEVLLDLGLTGNEATTYLALLELDKAHVAELAERTCLHRRTIYDCLERLRKKGLAGFHFEGKTGYFTAVNPKRFLEILKEKESRLQTAMPELAKIAKKSKEKINTTLFLGREGLKTICEDVLESAPKQLLSLHSTGKQAVESLPVYIAQFHKKRIENNIEYKGIFYKSEKAVERIKELNKMDKTNAKHLPYPYLTPISFWIYGNKIAFMGWEDNFGILVESSKIASGFKKHFNALWKMAK